MYNYNPGSSNDQQYQAAYRQAERRVRAKLGFYWHLASYVLVNGLLIVIYLLTGPLISGFTYPWFIWPMFGWGIGLLFHFMGTFVFSSVSSDDSRRRMIEAEMRRMGAYPPGSAYPGTPATPGGPGGTTGSFDKDIPPEIR